MSLSPKPVIGGEDRGAMICACFAVGATTIRRAIASGNATNAEEIGALLKAGTNYGSCVPEIKQIIEEMRGNR